MLATTIFEESTNLVYPDGYKHDRSLDGVRKRVSAAQKFVLDPQASAMAANVALSKPSSIVAALSFIKLPSDPMWIEFANNDASSAMDKLGSPNKQLEIDTVVRIERSGFLMRMEGNDLVLEFVHTDRTPDGRKFTDVAPVEGRFSLRGFEESPLSFLTLLAMRKSEDPKIGSGKFREHVGRIHTDPEEARADAELRTRFRHRSHPDVARVRENLVRMVGEAGVQETEENQSRDMFRLFTLQILPALILLNCRNAVDSERVPAPEKLNKQRLKKGRPPIQEHHLVKIHLSPARRRIYEATGSVGAAARGGMVIGHFKVRKSGIYWWSPHWRGSTSNVAPEKTYVLTR